MNILVKRCFTVSDHKFELKGHNLPRRYDNVNAELLLRSKLFLALVEKGSVDILNISHDELDKLSKLDAIKMGPVVISKLEQAADKLVDDENENDGSDENGNDGSDENGNDEPENDFHISNFLNGENDDSNVGDSTEENLDESEEDESENDDSNESDDEDSEETKTVEVKVGDVSKKITTTKKTSKKKTKGRR